MSPRRSLADMLPRTTRVICWIAFVIVTPLTAYLLWTAIGAVVDPSTTGHIGTAVVIECDYNHDSYRHCFGDFKSSDGQVSLTNTQIWGEDGAHAGDKFTAYGDPGTKTVTVPSVSDNLTNLFTTAVFLGLWFRLLWVCVIRPLRRRRARAASADGGA